MSDVHEDLVRRYFERQGYLTRTNVPYRMQGDRGQWSDIDLCVLHPVRNDAAAVEVKGWGDLTVTLATIINWHLFNFVENAAAHDAATTALGRNDFRGILVLPRVVDQDVEAVRGLAEQHQVEILEWRAVLQFLITDIHNHINPPPASESENVIRALIVHGRGEIIAHPLGGGQ